MRVGVIFTAWQMAEYLPQSLGPWTDVRAQRLDDHEIVICAINVPFAGFPQAETSDVTTQILKNRLEDQEIDHLITSDEPMAETEARGAALTYLKTRDVDIVVQWDADEITTEYDISRILRYVDGQPYVAWFRISYANLVFDRRTRLVDPFTPPRIHRVQFGIDEATHFSADNDIAYGPRHQSALPSMTIPEAVAAPLHYSWVADDETSRARCRAKIRYQLEGRQWPSCSFAWDDADGLIFNPALSAPRTQRLSAR